MGRILMINDADFSQNAIGKVYPSGVLIKSKLKNDGASYINTNVVLTNADVLTIKGFLHPSGVQAAQAAFLFGWRNADGGSSTYGNVQVCKTWAGANKIPLAKYIVGGHGTGYGTFDINEEHTFVMDFANSAAYIDGSIYNRSEEVDFSHALGTFPLMLFCVNLQGTAAGFAKELDYISYCTITRSGEKILDLVPCVYNGVAGMWDRVSETFFGAANGGVFIAE